MSARPSSSRRGPSLVLRARVECIRWLEAHGPEVLSANALGKKALEAIAVRLESLEACPGYGEDWHAFLSSDSARDVVQAAIDDEHKRHLAPEQIRAMGVMQLFQGRMVRRAGGFWTYPGAGARSGKEDVPEWHVSTRTMQALERRGLLEFVGARLGTAELSLRGRSLRPIALYSASWHPRDAYLYRFEPSGHLVGDLPFGSWPCDAPLGAAPAAEGEDAFERTYYRVPSGRVIRIEREVPR